MAVKIRWRQQGRKNRQTYRLVVTDIRKPRDGKYLEMVGSYDPLQKEGNVLVNEERLHYWLGKGAQLTHNAERAILRANPQALQQFRKQEVNKRLKAAAQRRKRKQEK